MDYHALRAAGLAQLERLTGSEWTDFNAHDPGITILEQLAYALTDLGHRVGYDVPDLLASGSADPYAGLHRAEQILTTHPVTASDIRRLVLDVEGVKNAWVESVNEPEIALHYHAGRQELSLEADPPASEPVALKGLHRILVEKVSGDTSPAGLRGRVARRLHANRPLCEDFVEIRVLDEQLVQVNASIEIGIVERTESVLLDVLDVLSDHLAPPLQFTSLDEATRRGVPADELFDGPLLSGGYLDPELIAASARRTSLRTSDLIHVIMDVPGVVAVTRITIAAGGDNQPWALALDPRKVPRLDVVGSRIELTRAGLAAAVSVESVRAGYEQRQEAKEPAVRHGPGSDSLFEPPSGRDRNVGRYHSIQHHLPALYGIGAGGLPDSASEQRKAQAKQLRAYLLLFDQLLANSFAQLANVGELFAFGQSTETYFAGLVGGDLPRAEVTAPGYQERMEEVVEPTADRLGPDDARGDRRHRFLDHLLARFAEEFSEQSLRLADTSPSGSETGSSGFVEHKRAFLANYPQVSSARGSAADAFAGSNHESGLARRIALKLGTSADDGERFLLVEHVLLRPIEEDRPQAVPVLTASPHADPYSLQLSFVFTTQGRFADPAARQFAELVVREETPAHLTPYIHWFDNDQWQAFKAAQDDWLDRRRRYLAGRYGIEPDDAGGR